MIRYPLAAQQSLTNFYESVEYSNPAMALLMSDHIRQIALYGLGGNRTNAYEAVIRVRDLAQGLPPVFPRVLDHALEDLGYSLLDVERYRRENLA
jgi:hypothetical protein